MRPIAPKALLTLLLVSGLLCLSAPAVRSRDADPPSVASPVRPPDDYQPQPLRLLTQPLLSTQDSGLRAVAIVGDVGDATDNYRQDMDRAVEALRSHGVAVDTFYYGERSFGWGHIVSAATGANILLYMGHGVAWEGMCPTPDLVGGLYLGPDGFVHPDQIRGDLAGRLAEDAVVILSHACFSAGATTCDGQYADWPTQAEAARRVRLYAAPFVDIGVKGYFANNYYWSTLAFVNHLMADESISLGEVFKSVSPSYPDRFRDISYPEAGYDLWMNGATGSWHNAFVGMPDYVFNAQATPQLGPLPESVTFTYFVTDDAYLPASYTLVPQNVGTEDPLTWEVTGSGGWFTVVPTSGETTIADAAATGSFTIAPTDADVGVAASYTGVVTLTVTSPSGTKDSVQVIDIGLRALNGSPTQVYFPIISRP